MHDAIFITSSSSRARRTHARTTSARRIPNIMGKGHVRVYVRTRPAAQPAPGFKVLKDNETLAISHVKADLAGTPAAEPETTTFKYDGVLDGSSQEAVYSMVAQDAVERVLSGYNSTLFCYGQTGAGKTFTMSGDLRNYNHRGLIPRALHQIFHEVDLRVDRLYNVQVSYMEIYNEELYDLLSDSPASSGGLAIMEDANNAVLVRGLSRVPVSSEEDALAHFFQGEQGRSTAHHALNAHSSRSHTLFTVYVEMRTSEAASERAVLSKLHLVDLAGSERTKKTAATGQSLREATAINKSLTYLEQVVNALVRQDAHVPFRQTKLTAALKDALGGNCITVMVANLWPESTHLEECVSTLRFASRVRTLVTDAVVNESGDPALLLKRAERQIKELTQELAMRDMLSGRARVAYDDLTEAEQQELQALVTRFLLGAADLDALPIDSIKHIRDTYKAFKAVAAAGGFTTAAAAGAAAAAASGRPTKEEQDAMLDPGAVGDADPAHSAGFHVGSAPAGARPKSPVVPAASAARGTPSPTLASTARLLAAVSMKRGASPIKASSAGTGMDEEEADGLEAAAAACSSSSGGGHGPTDRNELFLRFKHGVDQGRQLAAGVKDKQQQAARLRQQLKDVAGVVNSSKARIDQLSQQLALKAAASPRSAAAAEGQAALDAEQYGWLQELKTSKTQYRAAFDELKELRGSLEAQLDGLAAAKAGLIAAFDAWALTASSGSAAGGAWRSSGARAQAGALQAPGVEDDLDAGEAFERLEAARIMATNPDSAAYHSARKKAAAATLRGGRAAA